MSSARIAPPAPELLLIQRWLRAQRAYAEATGDREAFSMTGWWANRLADLIDAAWRDNAELLRELLDQVIAVEKAVRSVEAEEPHDPTSRQVRDA